MGPTDLGANREIAVVGPVPPPVHGFAVITRAMADELSKRGPVTVFDTSPRAAGRSPFVAVRRAAELLRVWLRFVRLARARRFGLLYVAVSGGTGQLADLAWLATARLLKLGIVLHHHSFAYLDRRSVLTAAMAGTAGRALHVALCGEMKDRLRTLYRIDEHRIVVVSNAAFDLVGSAPGESAGEAPRPLSIGFLSAVSLEKGIDVFLRTARRALADGSVAEALVAGPADASMSEALARASADDPRIRYLGPVHAAQKRRFLERIDVLLFPSRYRNEAEPVVLLEALASGVPVVSTVRGCIGEQLGRGCHASTASDADFEAVAASALSGWSRDGRSLALAQAAARRRYETLRAEGRAALDTLIAECLGQPASIGASRTDDR